MTAPSIPDLAARILEAIDRTEEIARAVDDNSAPWDGQWKSQYGLVVRTYNGWVLVHGTDAAPLRTGLARHIAHNDPATVLRRCAADRRILNAHLTDVLSDTLYGRLYSCHTCHRFTDEGTPRWWCETLLALADGYGITVDGAP